MTGIARLDTETLAMLKEVMEDEFDQLIETYLADANVRKQALRDALQRQDADALRKTAHSLKGSSSNIGATQLAQHCLALESAAQQGNLSGLGATLELLEKELEAVEQELSAL